MHREINSIRKEIEKNNERLSSLHQEFEEMKQAEKEFAFLLKQDEQFLFELSFKMKGSSIDKFLSSSYSDLEQRAELTKKALAECYERNHNESKKILAQVELLNIEYHELTKK